MLPVLMYIAIVVMLGLASNLICADDLVANETGNLLTWILNIVGFSGCEGTPVWFSWGLTLLVAFPGLVLLGVIVGPILSGIAANPIAGTILALAALTAIAGILIGVYT